MDEYLILNNINNQKQDICPICMVIHYFIYTDGRYSAPVCSKNHFVKLFKLDETFEWQYIQKELFRNIKLIRCNLFWGHKET